MNKWKQHNEWYIRTTGGHQSLSLNSEAGADYVLWLQDRLAQLENRIAQVTTRKKPGPKETK